MEKWADIKGYEGLYMVSNLGNVKALPRVWHSGKDGCTKRESKEKMLCKSNVLGYLCTTLCKDGKTKMYKIHRLMAFAFIDKPNNKSQINHINGIKNDNRIENLEWVDNKENAIHAYKLGLNISRKYGEHNKAKKIRCNTLDMVFGCAKEAAEKLGLDPTAVARVAHGTRLHTQGFDFKYI